METSDTMRWIPVDKDGDGSFPSVLGDSYCSFSDWPLPFLERTAEIVQALVGLQTRAAGLSGAIETAVYFDPTGWWLLCGHFDIGVSVDFEDGAGTDWWISTSWDGKQRVIEPAINRHEPQQDGSSEILTLPVTTASTLEELFQRLLAACLQLDSAPIEGALPAGTYNEQFC